MVYITSELFGFDSAHNPSVSPFWNSMANSPLTTGLGKRKRRTEDHGDGPLFGGSATQQYSSSASAGVLRLQGQGSAPLDVTSERPYPLSVASPTSATAERRPIKQMKRLLTKIPSYLMDAESDVPPGHSNVDKERTPSSSDLRPCHACKKAPKRRRDLENYMECRRCEGRTCYICARECLLCQKAICNKCIVEQGQEGDSFCLDCYSKRLNTT